MFSGRSVVWEVALNLAGIYLRQFIVVPPTSLICLLCCKRFSTSVSKSQTSILTSISKYVFPVTHMVAPLSGDIRPHFGKNEVNLFENMNGENELNLFEDFNVSWAWISVSLELEGRTAVT